MVQSAILHRPALSGEACRSLSPELRQTHREVPWPQIIAFRNIVVHEYFGIDLELVWAIIGEHLSTLASNSILLWLR
ncbi:MAG: DUF86 domain-containing protein [Acidobacteria bacterium]|nr:DUF86 domain-containing protein [Acidobacteriota bacterium]